MCGLVVAMLCCVEFSAAAVADGLGDPAAAPEGAHKLLRDWGLQVVVVLCRACAHKQTDLCHLHKQLRRHGMQPGNGGALAVRMQQMQPADEGITAPTGRDDVDLAGLGGRERRAHRLLGQVELQGRAKTSAKTLLTSGLVTTCRTVLSLCRDCMCSCDTQRQGWGCGQAADLAAVDFVNGDCRHHTGALHLQQCVVCAVKHCRPLHNPARQKRICRC